MFNLKSKNNLKNKKGITLIQLFVTLIILIIIMVAINPIGLIQKSYKAKDTASWSTDLNGLSSDLMARQDIEKSLFFVSIKDGNSKTETHAPPVSANESVKTYNINDYTVSYSSSGVTVTKGGSPVPAVTNVYGEPSGNMENFSKLDGSNGFHKFINEGIPDIEKHLYYGLFNGVETGKGISMKSKKNDDAEEIAYIKGTLSLILGDSDTKNSKKIQTESWVSLVQVDQGHLKDKSGSTSRFLNNSKYRMYYVKNIISEEQALANAASNTGTDKLFKSADEVKELYNAMREHISEGAVIIMPIEKSDVVYTEGSDFEFIKFSLND